MKKPYIYHMVCLKGHLKEDSMGSCLKCINFEHVLLLFLNFCPMDFFFLFYIRKLLLKGVKRSNKKPFTFWFVPGVLSKLFYFCMPNIQDLSDNGYFFI